LIAWSACDESGISTNAKPSVNTAKPAMREHFKTGQVSRAQDLQLF
jgi:hypothetical protein